MTAIGQASVWHDADAARTALDTNEWRFRLVAAWVLWYLLFQASLGLAWDIRWHGAVGRDSFWTPPHLLLYTGITLAGLLCLGVVLLDTRRYYAGAPGVTAGTTWPALRVFHAPLGFIVAGSGLTVLLLAAPFDNWWHELYGIDVVLWSPFHVMGLVGATIAGVGLVYAFAALLVRARREGRAGRPVLGFTGLEWATLLALSGVLNLLLTASQPATTISPTIDLGRVSVLTYPLLLGAFLPGLFVAAVRLTGRPGAATALLALYLLRQVLTVAFVPWGIRLMVDAYGYEYRSSAPRFSLFLAFSALIFLPTALVVDLLASARRRRAPASPGFSAGRVATMGVGAAVALLAIAPRLVGGAGSAALRNQLPPEFVIPTIDVQPALALAIVPTLVLAVLGAWLGAGWGALLRYNDR